MSKKYDFCNLNIKNNSDEAELFFYGDIVSDSWDRWKWEDKCPQNIVDLLNDIGSRDINIRINSPGGDVFAGFAIYNLLKRAKGKKTVYIDGCAASIASVIAMAGDQIVMPGNAFLMIHKPYMCVLDANADDMRHYIEVLDKLEDGIITVYAIGANSDVTCEGIKKMLAAETWLNAEDAAKIFKNIKVVSEMKAAAKIGSAAFKNFRNTPEQFKQQSDIDMSDFFDYANLIKIKYSN